MHPTSFNRCNLPPWVIASREFDEHPRPIELQGVREGNRRLFEALDTMDDPDARARRFDDKFGNAAAAVAEKEAAARQARQKAAEEAALTAREARAAKDSTKAVRGRS